MKKTYWRNCWKRISSARSAERRSRAFGSRDRISGSHSPHALPSKWSLKAMKRAKSKSQPAWRELKVWNSRWEAGFAWASKFWKAWRRSGFFQEMTQP
ncbi:hypothetical protein D3C74_460280 [compost metagenome]